MDELNLQLTAIEHVIARAPDSYTRAALRHLSDAVRLLAARPASSSEVIIEDWTGLRWVSEDRCVIIERDPIDWLYTVTVDGNPLPGDYDNFRAAARAADAARGERGG